MADISSDTCLKLLLVDSDDRMGVSGRGKGDVVRRTRSTADVVEGEVSDKGVLLHEQGQRLANATGGTENGNLGGLRWKLRWLARRRRAPRQCFLGNYTPGWQKRRSYASGGG